MNTDLAISSCQSQPSTLEGNLKTERSAIELSSAALAIGRHPLVRPLPKAYESWPGYLLRLANANGYAGFTAIAGLCGKAVRDMIAFPQWGLLRSLGIEATQRLCHPQGSLPRRIKGPYWTGLATRSRLCPACVAGATDFYVPAPWDSPLLGVCKQHGLLLIDQCDRCSRPIDYNRDWLDTCNCGRKFKDVTAPPEPEWYGSFEQAFERSVDMTKCDASRGKRRDVEAARAAMAMASIGNGREPGSDPDSKKVFVGTDQVSSLAAWFTHWPDNFRSQLSKHFDLADTLSKQRARYFLRASYFPGIERQFEEIAAISPLACKRSRKDPNAPKAASDVSLNKFCKMTRLSQSVVRSLVRGGHLRVTAGEPDSMGRREQVVNPEVAQRIQSFHDATYSIDEAARVLKCSARLVRAIISVGQLPAWTAFAGHQSTAVTRLRLDEIATLLRKFDAMAITVGEANARRIPFHSALIHCLDRAVLEKRYVALVTAIRHGALTLYRADAPAIDLAEFSLDEEAFRAWVKRCQVEPLKARRTGRNCA